MIFTVLESNAKIKKWVPSPTGIGIGILVPFSVVFTMFLGGIASVIWEKVDKKSADLYMVPLSSGFIAGRSPDRGDRRGHLVRGRVAAAARWSGSFAIACMTRVAIRPSSCTGSVQVACSRRAAIVNHEALGVADPARVEAAGVERANGVDSIAGPCRDRPTSC